MLQQQGIFHSVRVWCWATQYFRRNISDWDYSWQVPSLVSMSRKSGYLLHLADTTWWHQIKFYLYILFYVTFISVCSDWSEISTEREKSRSLDTFNSRACHISHFPTELKQCSKFSQRSDIRFLKAKMVYKKTSLTVKSNKSGFWTFGLQSWLTSRHVCGHVARAILYSEGTCG